MTHQFVFVIESSRMSSVITVLKRVDTIEKKRGKDKKR